MMKKHISKLFFILAVMLIPGFLSAQEREISVEDQYYEDPCFVRFNSKIACK